MLPLEPEFLDLPQANSQLEIALLTTTRQGQLAEIIKRISNLYKSSSITLITQARRKEDISNDFPGMSVEEALPSGQFKIWKAPLIKYSSVREIKPDIVIIAYNNLTGIGYFSLEFASLFFSSKRVVGVFAGEDDLLGNIMFCELSLWKMFLSGVLRVIIFPLEIMFKILSGFIYAFGTIKNRLQK